MFFKIILLVMYMVGKAYFFRNIDNYLQLREKTIQSIYLKKVAQPFKIIRYIRLSNMDYLEFKNDFKKTYSFISDISYKLNMNNNYEYVCILVYSEFSEIGYLVNSCGYSYPRNIAEIKLGEFYGM